MKRHWMVVICVLALVGCGGGDTTESEESAPTAAQSSEETPVVTSQPTDEEAGGDERAAGGGEEPSGGGGDGPELIPAGDTQVAINGESVPATDLLRCIPFDSAEALGLQSNESTEEQLDLQVLGDGYILFIGVSPTTEVQGIRMGGQSVSIQGRAVGVDGETGVFETSVRLNGEQWFDGTEELDGPLMEWTGDRVTGSATLTDVFEAADPIEVTFDVVVPAEVQDCSL